MKNPIAQLNSIQLGKAQNVVLLHHDGFCLIGSVVHAGIHGIQLMGNGMSTAIDFSTAISEVLDQIKQAGVKKIPEKTYMVSAAAISALINLPVNPEKPRTPQQMAELVRWEMEPLFAQQADRWCIGSLLMGRGYLDQSHRANIMTEVLSRNAASNQRLTVRFGEVAQEQTLVNREQIDECLAVQEKLVQFDDDLVCGWAPQKVTELEMSDEEGGNSFPWFVNAISDGLRKQWVKACQRHKLFLTGIYPMLGAGFSHLEVGERDFLFVDLQQEDYVVMRGAPGNLKSYRLESAIDGLITAEQIIGLCYEEIRPDINQIILNAPKEVFAALSDEISAQLERPVVASFVREQEQMA